jgi:hypothetical protein
MIDKNGTATLSVRPKCVGALGRHIDGFAAFLLREGYASRTVQEKCYLVMELSRCVERRRLPLIKLDEEQLTRFFAGSSRARWFLTRSSGSRCLPRVLSVSNMTYASSSLSSWIVMT